MLLAKKRGLIVGIANERSIAYGIARAARAQGAELVLTYQGERLEQRVRALGQELQAEKILPLDVTDDAALGRLGDVGPLDFVVHAVATAELKELDGRFLDTSREGFRLAMDV